MRSREKGRGIAPVKLFGSLLPPLYYSVLSWRKTIFNRLSISTRADCSVFSLSFSLPFVSAERTAKDNILIQWENPSNARLLWQERADKPKQSRDRKTDRPDTMSVSLGLLARLPFSETSGFKGIIHFTV